VLGGGLPEFSFNVVAGAPGAGKTTLVQQIMFTLARRDRPALYFTVLGEPPLKMLRYQQQFEFFNTAEVNASVRFVNLAKEALEGGLDEVLRRIVQEVEAASAAIVIVDSFRSVFQAAKRQNGGADLPQFVQDLGIRLTGWQATTFLIGEFQLTETEDHPVFTVADGLVGLYQSLDRNSMVRKLQVMKMRGQAPIPGLHTFRITNRGIQVFPRLILDLPATPPVGGEAKANRQPPRVSVGVPGLDEMLGGGIPSGQSVLVAGPSGSGKTVLATQFIREGVRRGELVACPRQLYSGFRAGHPARLRCSSIKYSRYSQSSRLAGRAPRSEIHCTTDEDRPLGCGLDEPKWQARCTDEPVAEHRVI
jgi:circadian clock protein KaiC